MTKVEEVAITLAVELDRQEVFFSRLCTDELHDCLLDGRADLVALARAAIAAMREPTYEMYQGYWSEQNDAISAKWQAMIDAILQEPQRDT